MDGITTKIARRKLLLAVKTAVLDTGELNLYQNDYTPNSETVLADMTVADFSGYGAAAIADWNDPATEPDGRAVVTSTMCVFASTGPTIQNTIFGWWLTDTDGLLVGAGRFDNPISMADLGDQMLAVVEYYSDGSLTIELV